MKRFILLMLLCMMVMPSALAQQTAITATVPDTHTITVNCGENGSITCDGTSYTGSQDLTVSRFGTLTVSIVPDKGCELDAVSVVSAQGVACDGKVITVSDVVADNTITLTFKGKPRLPGDVNNDGKVDGRDALLLEKYLAGYEVTINMENANVTGDTKIDGRDALLLEKYLAGYDVTLK